MAERPTPTLAVEAAPPTRPASGPGGVACAFCGSTDTEMIALFGQQLMSSQYYCNNCHTVFEAVRWHEEVPES